MKYVSKVRLKQKMAYSALLCASGAARCMSTLTNESSTGSATAVQSSVGIISHVQKVYQGSNGLISLNHVRWCRGKISTPPSWR